MIVGKGPAYEWITATTPDIPGLLSVQASHIYTAAELAEYPYALNLHFGPLPEFRGCFPTKWAIITGAQAGVTLHHMTPQIDAGPILSVVRTPESRRMTDGDLYLHLNQLAFDLWRRWLPRVVAGFIPPGTLQDESKATYYPRVMPYGGVIPDDASDELRERLTRAFA
jgi:methionyl-tRNA formyltransferase